MNFDIYMNDQAANRNDLVDRLLNGTSLETCDGRFAWVNSAHDAAMFAEMNAVAALVAAFESDYAAM